MELNGPVPVVVVGAGPTGVTAATLLSAHGVPSLLLERWPDVYPQPRAVHLDDEVHRILTSLGVAEEFAAISQPSLGLRLLDDEHRVLAEFDRGGPSPVNGHPRASMFDQPALEALLRDNLRRHPLVRLRTGVEVTGVRRSPGLCELDVRDVETGEVEVVRARFVLGCDGANSVVREQVGAEYEDLGFEQRWLVVDVDADVDLRQWEGVHQVCDGRRAATYMRVGPRRYRWEFQLADDESAADFGSIEALRSLLHPWTAGVASDDLRLVRVADYTFHARLADRWRTDGVFLLGDAAHLTPPFIGQGMGAGLRDAANLAWKLAGVVTGTLPDAVLDTYEQERKPHARSMIRLAQLAGVTMTAGGLPGDAARRVLAPRLARVPVLRSRLVDSTTPPLRGRERRRRGSLAGHLAPNVISTGHPTLDQQAGTDWAVVSLDPLAPSEQQTLASARCRVVVVPSDGPLGRWLRDAGARAALVRPDRTVHAAHACPSLVTSAAVAALTYGQIEESRT